MKRSHHRTVYNLQYHLVLVTKYRRKCLTAEIRETLKEKLEHLCGKWEIELKEFGGEDDHIHLTLDCHPSLEIGKLVNNLKTVSSRFVRKNFKAHIDKYLWNGGLWTRAYYICSVGGAPIDTIKKYIEKQGKLEGAIHPHSNQRL